MTILKPSMSHRCCTTFRSERGPFTSLLAIVVFLSSILGFLLINIGKVVAMLGTSAVVQTKSSHSNLYALSSHFHLHANRSTLICTQIAALSSHPHLHANRSTLTCTQIAALSSHSHCNRQPSTAPVYGLFPAWQLPPHRYYRCKLPSLCTPGYVTQGKKNWCTCPGPAPPATG